VKVWTYFPRAESIFGWLIRLKIENESVPLFPLQFLAELIRSAGKAEKARRPTKPTLGSKKKRRLEGKSGQRSKQGGGRWSIGKKEKGQRGVRKINLPLLCVLFLLVPLIYKSDRLSISFAFEE
jgi:hypothetical protein